MADDARRSPLHLARVIRLDDSDLNVFERAAEMGEWAVPGTFAFSNWTESDLKGRHRQAFAHGWLGLESFGRATVVAVTPITPQEVASLTDALAAHFVERYGAPDIAAARPVAARELEEMADICADHPPNTLVLVERRLETVGVRERFRQVAPRDAPLEAFAVHGS